MFIKSWGEACDEWRNMPQELPISYQLLPIHFYILLHLKKAGVDYANMMAKMTELDVFLIKDAINDLLEAGLIERDSGSAVKRSKARFKKAFEVHKHHTYYRLSRKGELFLRSINEEWVKRYFTKLFSRYDIVHMLAKSSDFQEACKKLGKECETLRNELILHRFITPSGKKTQFFKLFSAFLEL